MRRRAIFLLPVLLCGVAGLTYFLAPVQGPERNLARSPDAQRGAYLLRVGGCVSCHTDIRNAGAYLAGGPGLETPFGVFYPSNITSDPDAGIGSWTLAEFSHAISNGIGKNGEHLYPSFPYENYTQMSDQDVVDLYAALMATVPVATQMPNHDLTFPFNIRFSLQGWKKLFFAPVRFKPDAGRSDRWNRGAYLANAPGHCGICHTPRNILGAAIADRHFAGSRQDASPFFPPVTPIILQKLGYTEDVLKEALTGGFDPDFDTLGGKMGEVVNESLLHYTAADLDALAAYLLDQD